MRGAISVWKGLFPAMKMTLPYSPSPLAKASEKPVKRAGLSSGKMTWKKLLALPAPSVLPASS